MRITMASGEPFAFAGLWDAWRDPKGEVVRSCAIITTSANESLSPIHDRMPVILPMELESLWLDHDIQDPAALDGILRPYPDPAEAMEVHEVSSMVNSPANDGPEVVVPVGEVRPGDGPALRLL
jgi:putative SOS response-associated peptidase YedK